LSEGDLHVIRHKNTEAHSTENLYIRVFMVNGL
jgi:hypothetical protein